MIVYKYLSDARIDVLRDSRIRFSQPTALNDPFEAFPSFEEVEEAMITRTFDKIQERRDRDNPMHGIMAKIMRAMIQQNLDEQRANGPFVLSLSKKNNNSIMWAHYTNSHRGFVIGLDADHLFFQGPDKLTEVRYSKTRYMIPGDAFKDEVVRPDLVDELIAAFCFTKSEDWAYEQE
jgi:hypothetical protein